MRRVKLAVVMALIALPMLLALPGCFWGWDDGYRGRDGGRYEGRREGGGDRHEDRHEGDRHDEGRGGR